MLLFHFIKLYEVVSSDMLSNNIGLAPLQKQANQIHI